VAGFAESELEITAQDNLLIVKGAHAAEQKERRVAAIALALIVFQQVKQAVETNG
jgi:molecular chaperone IbpA